MQEQGLGKRTGRIAFVFVLLFCAIWVTLLTEYPVRTAQIGTLGTAYTMMELGGMWI